MELEPLVHREGSKDRVVDDFRSAKLFTCPNGGGVQAEEIATCRLEHCRKIERAGWEDVFGRLSSFGEITKVDQNEGRDSPFEWGRTGRERLPFLQTLLEAFRGAQKCTLEVFDHFGDRPLVRLSADRAFVTATARSVFDGREALLEVTADHNCTAVYNEWFGRVAQW